MRKYSKFIAGITAVAALAAPTAALANSSGIVGANGTGNTQGSAGVTQYKATYTDPYFGGVSCSGTHHAKGNFDSWTCTSTTGNPLTYLSAGQTLAYPNGSYPGWASDYNGTLAKTFTATDSADGMSYTATATY